VVAQRVGRCAALEESLRAQGRTDDEAVPAFADAAAAAAAAAATAHGGGAGEALTCARCGEVGAHLRP
jgi:hypothetical protein